jgi:hypothetical protein
MFAMLDISKIYTFSTIETRHLVTFVDSCNKTIKYITKKFAHTIESTNKNLHTGEDFSPGLEFYAAIAAIAVEGEQNAVDHCGNDGNFLPYSAIFILFTVHYHFDT